MVLKTDFKSCGVLFLMILMACLCLSAHAQTGEWTWMGGSRTVLSQSGQSGVYGALGTPAAGNAPGSRDTAANWTDSNGNLWIFGGWGYDANGDSGYLNDLWEFNPSTNQWAWMGGSNTVGNHGGQHGVYGTLGTPDAGNVPGSRNGAAYWTDNSGKFWLFGGWDYDANSVAGELNDLWEFDPASNEWTWMSGSSRVGPHDGQSGTYGALGTPAAGVTPGGLYAPSSWTDGSGQLWLFGGQGYDTSYGYYELNGLWVYDPLSGYWAWKGGSQTIPINGDQPGIYGVLGTPAAGNAPGNRSNALSWTDGSGNLWLFGGEGFDAIVDNNASFGWLSDLWEFSPASGYWAWMGGSDASYSNPGVYGAQGTAAIANFPGSREAASTWTDRIGNLWLFAGNGIDSGGNWGYLNDLWQFNPSANEWSWMSGGTLIACSAGSSPDNCGLPGVYGAMGTAAPGNAPGARYEATSWTDGNGNLWLFGGDGFDANGTFGYLNDLWRYQPSSASVPAAATPDFSVPGGTYFAAQTVTLSDSTPFATIYYTTNGNAPTTASSVYIGPLTISSTTTLEAMATASGYTQSPVTTAVYTITPQAATPAFSIPAGNYLTAQTVYLSDTTLLATIYYTVNGTTPTTGSTIYSGPITVSSTETLEAMATAFGYSPSLVATAAYTITPPAATPTFSVPAGIYSAPQSVILSDATPSATIYYTTDGTPPSTASPVYSIPIVVSASEVVEAIATAAGYTQSAVAMAAYTINQSPPSFKITGTNVTVTQGATTGNTSTITVTPSGGFIGSVTLSAAVSSSPAGAQNTPTLSFGSTTPVTITGLTPATATLTITTEEKTSSVAYPRRPGAPWYEASGATLACILLFALPSRRRKWRTMLGMLTLLVALAGGTTACGGHRHGLSGTTAGTYTVTVTGTSGTTTEATTLTLDVQ